MGTVRLRRKSLHSRDFLEVDILWSNGSKIRNAVLVGNSIHFFVCNLSWICLLYNISLSFTGWILTVAMTAVLIYELVLNSQQQGSPVSFKASFFVINTQSYVLISFTSPAYRKLYAGALWIRVNLRWRSISPLHERCPGRPCDSQSGLYERYCKPSW